MTFAPRWLWTLWRRWLLAWVVLACAGCATVKPGAMPVTDNDPF